MTKTKNKSPKIARTDGLYSAVSNFGNSSKDSTLKSTFTLENLQQKELADYYTSSDLFARVIDIPVEEMMRAGFVLKAEEKDDTGEYCEWSDNLNLNPKIESGLKWAGVFGGAGMVLGCDDSLEDYTKPFNPKAFNELKFAQVFDRFYLTYGGTIEKKLTSKNFNLPFSYLYTGVDGGTAFRINSDRIIRFEGIQVPQINRAIYNYWGAPILERLREPLMDFLSACKSAAYLLQKTGVMSYQISDLNQMLALNADGNRTGDQKLIDRLRAMELSMSVINGIVLNTEEKAERLMVNFAGIPEMLEKAKQRFGVATSIPHTILFNESPSGLGATGNSEMKRWEEYIAQKQQSVLKPILQRLIDLFYLQRDGKIPKYVIKFNPLSIPTPTEIVDIQTKRVANIRGLVQDQLITPESGIYSLVDDDDLYSLDLEIDDSMIEALANTEEEIPAQED